jgi:hypothetical protein
MGIGAARTVGCAKWCEAEHHALVYWVMLLIRIGDDGSGLPAGAPHNRSSPTFALNTAPASVALRSRRRFDRPLGAYASRWRTNRPMPAGEPRPYHAPNGFAEFKNFDRRNGRRSGLCKIPKPLSDREATKCKKARYPGSAT